MAARLRIGLSLALLLLCGLPLWGQAWSGILSNSRAIDWSGAGLPSTLPDGETTANPWTPPTRTTSCGTVTGTNNAAVDVPALQNAINACTTNGRVLTLNGTFAINARVNFYGNSITYRGTGPQSTIINLTGSGELFLGATAGGGPATLTSSPAAGATSFTVTSGSPPPANQIAYLTQCDTNTTGNPCTGTMADNGSVYVCGYNNSGICSVLTEAGEPRHQQQTIYVTNVTSTGGSNYTVTFTPGLYMPNWSTARTPTLTWNPSSFNGVGIGLEDMTIKQSGVDNASYASNELIEMSNTYASWVKGVRFIGGGAGTALYYINSSHGLISNNYFYVNANPHGSNFYSAAMEQGGTSDSLVLNNLSALGILWEGFGGNTGNVIAYNYVTSMFTEYVENSFFDHVPFSSFDLFEGNQSGVQHEDDTHGSGALNTYFRNYLSCIDPPFTTYGATGSSNPGVSLSRGLVISDFHRFVNVVGNAIGSSACTIYQGSAPASAFQIDLPHGDSLVTSTLMRWGNVTTITQSTDTPANSGIRFLSSEVPSSLPSPNASFSNPVPGSTTLPASFFMPVTAHPSGGTGLTWWKICTAWTTFPTSCSTSQTQPLPPVGPDVSGATNSPIDTTGHVNGHAYDIPAAVAYRTLPPDPAFQSTFTMTGSSWSGGIETLTGVSPAFPASNTPGWAGEHEQGPFTLTGVSSACLGGATELVLTGATTNSFSYALAVNPGVSCVGTIKFPNIRQFDERVYQLDSGGGTTFTLSTATAGTGSGTVSCSPSGSGISAGTPYSCTVTPTSGTIASVTGCGGSGTTTYTGTMPSSNCTVTATFAAQAATPAFSPAAGSYSSPQWVTILDSTPGATIFYTVDGSTPTTSSAQYTHRLNVAQTQTLKAVATASGYTNSAVASSAFTIAKAKTRFSLTPTSSPSTPVPYPPDLRACCGSNVASINSSSGSFNFTVLHNWIAKAVANGSTFTYTIQGFPTWMTGLSQVESAPPSDLHTATSCPATGTTTTDCSMKSFVIALMKDRTGLSSQPASPTTCTNLDYLEIINEFNTDSLSGSSTGWTGTYADLSVMANDISTYTHLWCANTIVVAGSASAVVGGHSNGENAHYDVALETLLVDWAAIPGASLPDAISFHIYGSRDTTIPGPMPTTLVSNSDPSCTAGNTPNSNCYIAVKDEVNQLNSSATLQNAAIVAWAKFLPIYSTEGGFGKVVQLGGTSTTTIGASYVAESMMAIAAQNPVNHMFYAADDPTWGCYWNCGSGSSAWLFAYNQMLAWLNGHSITGPLTSTAITGGKRWSLQLDSGSAELDFCDAWLTNCTTTTTFNTQTTLAGVTSPTGGALTLTQEPVLLTSSTATFTIASAGSGSGSFSGSNCANGTYANGTPITCTATASVGVFAGWTGTGSASTCSGTGSCTFTLAANSTLTGTFTATVATPTFSPVGGTYATAQAVTISDATSGASLFYTTDGSTPTTSSAPYSGPISVAVTTTVKAIAAKSGWTNSGVGTALYTISPAPAGAVLSGTPILAGTPQIR